MGIVDSLCPGILQLLHAEAHGGQEIELSLLRLLPIALSPLKAQIPIPYPLQGGFPDGHSQLSPSPGIVPADRSCLVQGYTVTGE
jgi:hypothetical protein